MSVPPKLNLQNYEGEARWIKNRNGTTSFRVSGWLLGERIRKNFKTREAAIIERGTLLLKATRSTQCPLRVR